MIKALLSRHRQLECRLNKAEASMLRALEIFSDQKVSNKRDRAEALLSLIGDRFDGMLEEIEELESRLIALIAPHH